MIRGKGATKEGKLGRAGLPQPGEDEPLHALITGNTPEAVKTAVDKVGLTFFVYFPGFSCFSWYVCAHLQCIGLARKRLGMLYMCITFYMCLLAVCV